jgi:hypothetical protein
MGKHLSDKAIFLSASEKNSSLGGKIQYILIFPGGKLSIYSFFRGEKLVWGENEYVTPVLNFEQ